MNLLEIRPEPDDIRAAAYGLKIPTGTNVDETLDRLIDKAIQRIHHGVPGLERRIDRGLLSPELVRGVAEDMVIRVLRNPSAYRQISLDDFTRMIDTAVSSGALYLSEDERRMLAGRPMRKAARSMRLGVPKWRLPGV